MSPVTRRTLLASAAGTAALAFEPLQNKDANPDRLKERHLLAGRRTPADLQKLLLARDQWHPFPPAADRAPWDALSDPVKMMLVSAAELELGKPYAPLPATLFLEYVRNGNRARFEAAQFSRRTHLRQAVLAECVEDKGRFLDDIADGIWTTCEETFWGVPAHISVQKRGGGLPDASEPIIDLFAAETGALLAWTDYLLGPRLDRVQPLLRARIAAEIERRLLEPYRDRVDFWWMGLNPREPDRALNNWNPWINSNLLACVLLMDTEPARRAATVYKLLTSLDRFLDSYHDDGGCDEGPTYWARAGGSLFDNLELLRSASGGALDSYSLPLVQEIGRYIYRVHIADDWFVNFADASAKITLEGDLVYRYGRAIKDSNMQALGAHVAQRRLRVPDSLGRALPAIFNWPAIQKAEAREALVREAWLPGIQVAEARAKAGTADGFYFAALGGHNAESHNHNDVGNCIVFLNGDPVLVDAGVETYAAKTFSPQRYDIWTMQSAYHNLPTINEAMQAEGRRYAARSVSFHSDDGAAEFSADIAAAYPSEAGVDQWQRTIHLDRAKNTVAILDRFAMREAGGKADMHLMTASLVERKGDRKLIVSGGLLRNGSIQIDIDGPAIGAIHTEEIRISDARMRPIWGARLYRTTIFWRDLPKTGELRFRLSSVGQALVPAAGSPAGSPARTIG